MKHFEDIWVQSEDIAEAYMAADKLGESAAIDDIMSRLHLLKEFDNMAQEEKNRQMGNILFMFSFLSKAWNINTWSAMRDAMTGYNIDVLDPDIESEL